MTTRETTAQIETTTQSARDARSQPLHTVCEHAGGEHAVGEVVWITGLSGAGKSTIARRVCELWRAHAPNVMLLDGDEFRAMMGDDLGHTPQDRLQNACRLARLCKLLSAQGIHVVCATMSLFHQCHDWNRHNLPRYTEIYVRTSLETRVRRDPKGLYRRALAAEIGDMAGLDLPFEEPQAPDMILDNQEDLADVTPIAVHILAQVGHNAPPVVIQEASV
jgi:adenylylsulfate kinase